MKIIYCSSSRITIDLGEEFENAVIEANGEIVPKSEKFRVFSDTVEQIEPIKKSLTIDEQKTIIAAI